MENLISICNKINGGFFFATIVCRAAVSELAYVIYLCCSSCIVVKMKLPRRKKIFWALLLALSLWLFIGVLPHLTKEGLIDETDVAFHLRSDQRQSEYIDKKGMHVIVGKYMGDALQKETPTFTQEELNSNGYSPIKGNKNI